ncbi:MAG: hypothetical protein NXH75_14260, partial [Halobacteriovoraceae bacterium]|nr:hypothetical protein [Halobacteriovoraceae bacterium]
LDDFGQGILKDYQYNLEGLSPQKNLRLLEGKVHRYYQRLHKCRLHGRLAEFTGLHDYTLRLEDCYNSLMHFPPKVEVLKTRLENNNNFLRILNPNNTLGRGYAYVKDSQGKLVSDTKRFDKAKDQDMTVYFKDGTRKVEKREAQ